MSLLLDKSFYFIRHGETDWNKRHITMGQTDIPLNETGATQAFKASEMLSYEKFSSIACSPLKRALQTANIIAEHYPVQVTIIDELKEASLGIIEGQDKGDRELIRKWRAGGNIDGAESFQDFVVRVEKGLRLALTLPDPVLIVSHGGVYWAVQKVLGLPFADLHNCFPMFHRYPDSPNHPWLVCEIANQTLP